MWPENPDGPIDEATKFVMHDRLVKYISEHYTDACVRDTLIFSTDAFFAGSDLARRDLLLTPDVPAHLSLAERGGWRKKWKHFVNQVTKATHDVGQAIEREVGKVIKDASGLITETVCAHIGAAAAGLTSMPAATAPAAPYVGTAVYFWCLQKGDKEIKKLVAQENVRKWKSGGGGRPGHHTEDMIMRPDHDIPF